MKIQAETSSIHLGWAVFLTSLVIVLWNWIAFKFPVVILSENQTLYIYSSISQVIAGIYGLTVAGYAFLRNQQDRMMDKDESLIEIFERIQKQQHDSVYLITVVSGLAIISSLLAIALREIEQLLIRTLATNTATGLFISSIGLTAYFVIDSMRPEKISLASESIKNEITSSIFDNNPLTDASDSNIRTKSETESRIDTKNNLAQFLIKYNIIESLLDRYVKDNFFANVESTPTITAFQYSLESASTTFKVPKQNWTKARIVRALASQGVINRVLEKELLELVKYRNALVHGREMIVDNRMLERVSEASDELKQSIHNYNNI